MIYKLNLSLFLCLVLCVMSVSAGKKEDDEKAAAAARARAARAEARAARTPEQQKAYEERIRRRHEAPQRRQLLAQEGHQKQHDHKHHAAGDRGATAALPNPVASPKVSPNGSPKAMHTPLTPQQRELQDAESRRDLSRKMKERLKERRRHMSARSSSESEDDEAYGESFTPRPIKKDPLKEAAHTKHLQSPLLLGALERRISKHKGKTVDSESSSSEWEAGESDND